MPRFSIAIIIAMALASGLADAQLYKWTDASGRTQYSDKPPSDAKSVTEMRRPNPGATPAAPPPGAAGKSNSAADQEQAFRKRQIERQESAQKLAKADDEKRRVAEQCQRSRQYLTGLDASGRQMRYDPKGERYFLDEAQIEREKQTTRAEIASNCK